jgi:hypothetical protein
MKLTQAMLIPVDGTGQFIRAHLSEVCIGITAAALMIVSPYISRAVQSRIGNFHWPFRFAIMIVLITAGYGMLSNVLYTGVTYGLLHMGNVQLAIWTGAIYLVLGLVARSRKHI